MYNIIYILGIVKKKTIANDTTSYDTLETTSL